MKRARKKRQSCAHLEKVVVDAVLQTKLQLSTSRSKERAVMLEDGPILIESDEENAVDMDLDRLLLEVGTLQAECVQVHKIQEENLTAMTDVCPGNQTLRELAFCFIVDR
mmetsp:Transcript_55489/g.81582  ORF Transcript_55489/g.81582 Transcript_55489/m.81582 type:complete len:110 (-) Transcript_55489:10-339(-)